MKPFRNLILLAPITVLTACAGKTEMGTGVGGSSPTASSGSTGGGAVAVGGAEPVGGVVSTGGSLTGGKAIADQGILDQINGAACARGDTELEVSPALLEFVIDVSGSMNDIPKGATQSKWEMTRAALSNAILNDLPDNTGIGMLLFPNMNTIPNNNDMRVPIPQLPVDTCVNVPAMVPVAPLGAAGSVQRSAVAQALAAADAEGGTPTDDAFEYAYSTAVLQGLAKYSYYSQQPVRRCRRIITR